MKTIQNNGHYLIKKMENDLSKFNIKLNDDFILKIIIIKNLKIDLNSPLFNIISKEQYFYEHFFVEIPIDKLNELKEKFPDKFINIKRDFINKLNTIDKSKIKYSFNSYYGNNFEILKKIDIEPSSIGSLDLVLINKNYGDGTLYKLLPEYFPNLSNLNVTVDLSHVWISGSCYGTNINIEEDNKSKLKKINLQFPLRNQKLWLYCHSYESLESLTIYANLNIYPHEFPKFLEEPNVVFNSLTTFHFLVSGNKIDIIYKISNALDNMPNLRDFQFVYFDKKLINKILAKKSIKKVNIGKNKDINKYGPCYSIEELNIIFPDANFDKIEEINIEKEKEEKKDNNNINNVLEEKEENKNNEKKTKKIGKKEEFNCLDIINGLCLFILIIIIYYIYKIFNFLFHLIF